MRVKTSPTAAIVSPRGDVRRRATRVVSREYRNRKTNSVTRFTAALRLGRDRAIHGGMANAIGGRHFVDCPPKFAFNFRSQLIPHRRKTAIRARVRTHGFTLIELLV